MLGAGYPNIQVIRPFNIIGPHQRVDGGFVVPRFVKAALTGNSLTLFGDGEQRRTFISVHDVVRFCLMLLARWPADPGLWHLTNPANRVSVAFLARLVNHLAESKAGVDYIGNPKAALGWNAYEEVPEKAADIRKALAFGWKPEISLEVALKEIINESKG